jgi:hypothetical protein
LSRGQPFWGLDGQFFYLGDLFGLFLFDGGHLGFELPFASIVNRDQVDGHAQQYRTDCDENAWKVQS